MDIYELKSTPEKGMEVFAARDFRQGEWIFHVDLRTFKPYTLAELENEVQRHPELNGDHANYIGYGKYVIEETPAAYMNHSCDPNCYFKMRSIAVYDVYAFRDIRQGEELTHDYSFPRRYKDGITRTFRHLPNESTGHFCGGELTMV